MHLVGFIIEMYHDARPYESKMSGESVAFNRQITSTASVMCFTVSEFDYSKR